MTLGECYGEIEYRGGTVIQRWRGSSGNVRLPYLLSWFLHTCLVTNLEQEVRKWNRRLKS